MFGSFAKPLTSVWKGIKLYISQKKHYNITLVDYQPYKYKAFAERSIQKIFFPFSLQSVSQKKEKFLKNKSQNFAKKKKISQNKLRIKV